MSAAAPPGPTPGPTPARTIAVCVDDFGLHAGVNDAVLRLARDARISTVSCMVGAPAWQEGAGALREVDASRLETGLHFDLTESPFDAALRASVPHWLMRAALGRLDRRAIGSELQRQLDRFEHDMGRAPSHVDGHQHVHQFPAVRGVLLDVLERRYPSRRPWLRSTRTRAAGWKPFVIESLGARALEREARERGFPMNGRLLGVYDFRADAARYRELLRAWLAQAGPRDELMCHPASSAPVGDPIGAARKLEYEVLGGPDWPALLQAAGLAVAPLSARTGGLPLA